jgi:hypothetical protein
MDFNTILRMFNTQNDMLHNQSNTHSQLLQIISSLTQLATAPIPAPSPSAATAPTIPIWDGTNEGVPLYLEHIELWKRHPFFSNVSWDATHPNYSPESLHIRSELLSSLKNHTILHSFLGRPEYQQDGVRMLHDLIEKLNPSRPEHLLHSVISLVGLQQEPNETGVNFMWRLRGLYSRLKDISIDKLFTILAIAGLNPDNYCGIINRFRAADPSITEASIFDLSTQVEQEDALRIVTSPAPADFSSTARRAQSGTTIDTDAINTNTSSNTYPPGTYPPGVITWKKLKEAYTSPKYCPHCFLRKKKDLDFHLNVGCPALASTGRVVLKDEAKAKAILDEYNSRYKKTTPSADDETTDVAEGDTTSHAAARRGRAISADITSAPAQKGGQLKTPPEQLRQGGSDELTAKTSNRFKRIPTLHDEYEEFDSDDE